METIDDIVREMRRYADEDAHVIGRDVLRRDIQTFADRTEKAHEADKKKLVEAQQVAEDALCKLADKSEAVVKHDLTTATDINVGSNAAKMREALVDAVKTLDDGSKSILGIPPYLTQLLHRLNAALSAPPRNCDVGTAEEQFKRFDKFCESRQGCYNCERYGEFKSISNCLVHWAQMPYEEGEAK